MMVEGIATAMVEEIEAERAGAAAYVVLGAMRAGDNSPPFVVRAGVTVELVCPRCGVVPAALVTRAAVVEEAVCGGCLGSYPVERDFRATTQETHRA